MSNANVELESRVEPPVEPQFSEDAMENYKRGEEHFEKGEYHMAVRYFTHVLTYGDDIQFETREAVGMSQNKLGICYFESKGVSFDLQKAIDFFQKASDRGILDATCNLGNIYYNGTEVPKDLNKAFTIYKSAVDSEFPRALRLVGDCYYKGFGVAKNYRKAIEMYVKGANAGEPICQDYMRLFYKIAQTDKCMEDAVLWAQRGMI
jgi:TPR repeat protein